MSLDQQIQIWIAVGAWLGAAATFSAVVVSLRLATRPEREAARELLRRFKELQALMPNLFREVAKDLRDDADGSTREFVLLSSRATVFDGRGKPRFTYFETEHPNLRGRVDMLRDAGYLDDATIQDTPIYKMREHFVRLLKAHA